jgi:hypothetical protein
MNQPSWFYKEISVPELADIQREVNQILTTLISVKDTEVTFFYIDRNLLETSVPSYTKFLDRLGLLERWKYSAVITTQGNKEFPIHVDALEWEDRCYGLNLPILNCEDSDTVWYDAEIIDELPTNQQDRRNSARLCVTETAKELCRMPASKPAWINISIPHRPESRHTNLRAVISARFEPEVHNLLSNKNN